MEMNRSEHVSNIRIGMLNARSIQNKEEFILESIKDVKLDIIVFTETWLQYIVKDATWIESSEFHSEEYKISVINRVNKRGGALALICSSKYKGDALPHTQYDSFESVIWSTQLGSAH